MELVCGVQRIACVENGRFGANRRRKLRRFGWFCAKQSQTIRIACCVMRSPEGVHRIAGRNCAKQSQFGSKRRGLCRVDRHRPRIGVILGRFSVQAHGFLVAAAPAVDCNSFTAKAIGEFIGSVYGVYCGFLTQVDGLADRGVAVLLKSRLHSDMPLRRDVVGALEDFADRRREIDELLNAAGFGDLTLKLLAVKALLLCELLKNRIGLDHLRAGKNLARENQRINRFDAARTIGDNADRTCRSHARQSCIADFLRIPGFPKAFFPVRERPAQSGKFTACSAGLLVHKLHEFGSELDAFFRIVGYSEGEQAIGESHHAETDLTIRLRESGGIGNRIFACIDNVIEEAHRQSNGLGQSGPVHIGADPAARYEFGKIDAAQRTGLIGQQRLLAAWISRLDLAERRSRIVAVDPVDEGHAGLAGPVGALDYHLPDFADSVAFGCLFGDGFVHVDEIDQIFDAVVSYIESARQKIPLLSSRILNNVRGFIRLEQCFHPGVGDFYGDVEIDEIVEVLLGVQKSQDVRVVDAYHCHVCTPAESALLNRVGGLGEDAPETDRPRSRAAARGHAVSGGSELVERKSRAAAGLLNQGGMHNRLENAFYAVFDRQDETGAEHSTSLCVHQSGRIGQKLQRCHEVVVLPVPGINLFGIGSVAGFCRGYRPRYPAEKLPGCFDTPAPTTLYEIPVLQNAQGIFAEHRSVTGRRMDTELGHDYITTLKNIFISRPDSFKSPRRSYLFGTLLIVALLGQVVSAGGCSMGDSQPSEAEDVSDSLAETNSQSLCAGRKIGPSEIFGRDFGSSPAEQP